GGAPSPFQSACGWRCESQQDPRVTWRPQGECIGWLDVDGNNLYLDRYAAYKAAQAMAPHGNGIEVSPETLVRRLHEKRWLVSTSLSSKKRPTYSIRRTILGKRADVLHVRPSFLGLLVESFAGTAGAQGPASRSA